MIFCYFLKMFLNCKDNVDNNSNFYKYYQTIFLLFIVFYSDLKNWDAPSKELICLLHCFRPVSGIPNKIYMKLIYIYYLLNRN